MGNLRRGPRPYDFPFPAALRRGIRSARRPPERQGDGSGGQLGALVYDPLRLGRGSVLRPRVLQQGDCDDRHQRRRRQRRHLRAHAVLRGYRGIRARPLLQSVRGIRARTEFRARRYGGNDGRRDAGPYDGHIPYRRDFRRLRVADTSDPDLDRLLRHRTPLRQILHLQQAHRPERRPADPRQRPGRAHAYEHQLADTRQVPASPARTASEGSRGGRAEQHSRSNRGARLGRAFPGRHRHRQRAQIPAAHRPL